MREPSTTVPLGRSSGELRYSNCWEDAETVVRALAPLAGARCLSIASAGDNTLSLLARGAREVVAVDLSRAQLALLELKMAAFRELSHEELLGFLGARPHPGRERVYRLLRGDLGPEASRFWDVRPHLIRDGVIHAGRLERYFRLFRHWLLPLVHSRARVAELLQVRTRAARERFYVERWDGWRWRLAFHLFFSRLVMGSLGRDRAFFRYAENGVAAPILERTRHGLTAVPTTDNPYLSLILTGHFGPTLPDYLEADRHEPIRRGLDRLRLVEGPVERVLGRTRAGAFDAFNLSDVSEYMDRAAHHRLLASVHRSAAPGARIAYWNLLVERQRPAWMGGGIEERTEAARRLHARTRTFFYAALVMELAR